MEFHSITSSHQSCLVLSDDNINGLYNKQIKKSSPGPKAHSYKIKGGKKKKKAGKKKKKAIDEITDNSYFYFSIPSSVF